MLNNKWRLSYPKMDGNTRMVCVIASKITSHDPETELKDFQSTCCVIQNFMLSVWIKGVDSRWTESPIQKIQQFVDIVGVDRKVENVVGIIWYGFTPYRLFSVDPKQKRKKGVDDVLRILPQLKLRNITLII